MFKSTVIALISLIILNSSSFSEETYSRISITKMSKQEFLDLHSIGMDVVKYTDGTLEVIAQPDDIEWLNNRGIPYIVDMPDMKARYREINKDNLTMGGFKTLTEIVAYLDSMALAYPTLLSSKFSIGTTNEGRGIWAVKVSDNFAVDEDEPEVLFVSLIHAREPAGAASLLHFMNHMLSNYGTDTEITDLVNDRELFFVPILNPDGYAYNESTDPGGGGFWRKNRRDNGDATIGVDLNRNYGSHWGYDDIGSSPVTDGETYRGTGPFSEPETQAIRDFIISREFVIVRNFHTYSRLELWPPGYDRFFDPYEEFYSNLGDSLTQFNGYEPQVGWRLYPTNGEADDWAWYDTTSKPRIISMTCEIGSEFWPPPFQIPSLVAENIWPNYFLTKIADNPYIVGPPVSPITIEPSKDLRGDFVLEWQHDDTVNPADSFSIYELSGKSTVTDDAEIDYGYWTDERMTRSSARSHSGLRSWHENTANRANHWLVATYPYEVRPDDSLKFWFWYEIEEDWDYFYAQVSTDGGFFYENLANDLTTNTSPNGLNLGNGITGSSVDWVYAKFDLSAFAGQQIYIRLSYYTDWGSLGEGIYIDDIENIEFYVTDSELVSGVIDTFYNFNEHASGDYWYRVKAIDGQEQVSGYSNLIHVNVPPGYLAGDANNDSSVNILDLNYLVNYIFRQGPAPSPFLGGDANCDQDVNILDLNFMVNYIFRQGPIPSCP